MRAAVVSIALAAICGAGLLVALDDGGADPGPAISSATPQELADGISANHTALRTGVDAWRAAAGDPPASAPPPEVAGAAVYLQAAALTLSRKPAVQSQVVALLPPNTAGLITEIAGAQRALNKLAHGTPKRKNELKTGPAPPLSELAGHYERAESASGIDPGYLPAIHLVETKFGKVRSNSVAGAKGPMQFIPGTWKIYGRGGNIKDPADAIPAAARLLRANGAPGDYKGALHSYNPSRLYVQAVRRYARVIARDPYGLELVYCWEA
jgi:membrane-bound lytic murein transglycosylase B